MVLTPLIIDYNKKKYSKILQIKVNEMQQRHARDKITRKIKEIKYTKTFLNKKGWGHSGESISMK